MGTKQKWRQMNVCILLTRTTVQHSINPNPQTWGLTSSLHKGICEAMYTNANYFSLTILTFSNTTGSIFFSEADSFPLFHLSSFSFYNDLAKQEKKKKTGSTVTNSFINDNSKQSKKTQNSFGIWSQRLTNLGFSWCGTWELIVSILVSILSKASCFPWFNSLMTL